MSSAYHIILKAMGAAAAILLAAAASGTGGPVQAYTVSLSPAPGLAKVTKSQPMKKIGTALAGLDIEYRAHLKKGAGVEAERFRSSNPSLKIIHDTVLIDAVASENADFLLKALAVLGIRDPAVFSIGSDRRNVLYSW